MVVKDINGARYAIHGSVLLDTVPYDCAETWLAGAPDADTLILCGTNPYPKTVKLFHERHPEGKIYAPHYTAYTLSGILGDGVKFELVRDKKTVGDLALTLVSQPGKGAYLTAECGGELYSGAEETGTTPEIYADPTVVLVYLSGCDYTETVAEKIAEGIRDAGQLKTRLIDLAAMDPASVVPALINAAGVIIGTPTVDGEAAKKVWELLTAMPQGTFAGKFASAFGAYTWNGDAVPHVIERMRQLKMNVIDGGYTVQYKPDENALKSTYEYGYYYACKLLNIPNTHRSKLVKCLVCGEIFDASLGVCPVCGVGMDKCVPVEDEIINHKEDTDRVYLVAGGGTAALNAAEAIRKRDKTGRILMISAEQELPINRPMLSKNMAVAARVENSIQIKDAAWFAENDIEIRLSTAVTAIDPEAKTAALSDDTSIKYDKLIVATGAECFIPPIVGAAKDGVITVRHLGDVMNIWSRLGKAKKTVVIGGGVLGLEAASELKKMRLEVTVLELAPQIMSRQLDDDTANALIKACGAFDVPVHTGVTITEITGENHVTGVKLADGTVFPADMVILSCGNRANIDAAKAAGVTIGRAIVVNERMETNIPDLYAAGDCAEFGGVNFQLWAEATEQGHVAGANAAGDGIKYVPETLGASFEGMNTKLFAIGDVGKLGRDYKLIEYRDEVSGAFRRYWFCDNVLVGGVLFGDTDSVPDLTAAVNRRSTYAELRGKL